MKATGIVRRIDDLGRVVGGTYINTKGGCFKEQPPFICMGFRVAVLFATLFAYVADNRRYCQRDAVDHHDGGPCGETEEMCRHRSQKETGERDDGGGDNDAFETFAYPHGG